jgi:dTDP-4-amino-4,6-dideoxygalactose transaminase
MQKIFNIPYFGIDRMYKNHSANILDCVNKVFESGKVLMGSEIDLFEKEIATVCNRKYAISVGSCTDALFFALISAGIKPGDEIIITSFSFIASVTPILRAGAVPVFIDIDPSNFMMDLNSIEEKITTKTKAIIGVHLFGGLLDIEKLENIAKKHSLILIEDTAQSIGAEINSRKAGSMGDISCISFDPTKIIGAFGNGGVILTNNHEYYSTLTKLRYHGKNTETNDFEILGYNSRIATSQAAILIYELKILSQWIKDRNEIADIYFKELQNISQLVLPTVSETCKHVFHKFVIQTEKRDELKTFLQSKGIQTMIHYDKALFEHSIFKNYSFKTAELINIHSIKNTVLSLPIYPELKEEEIRYICDTIKDYYSKC